MTILTSLPKLKSNAEKDLVVDILNHFQDKYLELNVPIFSFKELFKILSNNEISFLSKFAGTGYKEIDFTTYQSIVLIKPQIDEYSKEFVAISSHVYKAFSEMNINLEENTNEKLYVVSGYRSPAYQTMIFLKYIYQADFNINVALSSVKLPSESEHSQYPSHAVDIGLFRKLDLDNKISTSFEETSAYKWLLTNANAYGFSLSYPIKNNKNIIFEPWHWLYSEIPQT